MKTQSLFEIAIETSVTISLIALLGLLTALTYALLSFLGSETTVQSILTSESAAKKLAVTNLLLPETTATLTVAKTEIVVTKPLAEMTVQELRPLARERKIPNWRKLKKKELLFYLTA